MPAGWSSSWLRWQSPGGCSRPSCVQSTVCAFRCLLPDERSSNPAFQSWSSWEHCLLTATFRATGSPFVRSIHHDGPPACRKSIFGLEDRTDFYKFYTNEPTTRSNHELKWEIPDKENKLTTLKVFMGYILAWCNEAVLVHSVRYP